MLKEIVEFSKQLEEIYEKIINSHKILNPILVIPINNNLDWFDIDKSYFVVKDKIIEKDKNYLVFDKQNGGTSKKEVNKLNGELEIKKIEEIEDEKWKNILFKIEAYTAKFSNDTKGKRAVGSSNGILSYNLFIFSRKKKYFEKDKLQSIFQVTYKSENIEHILDNVFENSDKENIKRLFTELINNGDLSNKIAKKVSSFLNLFIKSFNDEITLIFKFPQKFYENDNDDIYKKAYLSHLKKKAFFAESKNKITGTCPICNQKKELNAPAAFTTFNANKPFLKHFNFKNKNGHNIKICRDCSHYVNIFEIWFLRLGKISLFPLFIDNTYREKTIELFKQKEKLEKLSFREIVENIYKKTHSDVLDFYLIIYNSNAKILAFDYISGFQFIKNGKKLFDVESLIDKYFFDSKLQNNYFSEKVDTKDKDLDLLLYSYRDKIFNYIYRAKYNNLSFNDINDMFFVTLSRKLKAFYDKEKKITVNFKDLFDKFYFLNKYFGGDFMGKVEEIKKKKKIENEEDLAYYLGQAVYFLFTKSKSESKNHSMVEPFINITNFKVLAMKFEELFNSYKHELPLKWGKGNGWFSKIWAGLVDNVEKEFNKELKMIFYAGYFDPDNIFFE